MDSAQVQELLEELGSQDGMMAGMEGGVGRLASVVGMDCIDFMVLRSKWGRQLAGLEPKYSIKVDSFMHRYPAAPFHCHAKIMLRKWKCKLGLWVFFGVFFGVRPFFEF